MARSLPSPLTCATYGKATRAAIGKDLGDRVKDLAAALKRSRAARERFDKLSFTPGGETIVMLTPIPRG